MSAKDQLIKDLKALQATVSEVDYKRRGYHVEVLLDNGKVRDFAQVMRRNDFYLVFVGGVHTAESLEVTYQFASFTVPCRVLGRAPVSGDGTVPTIFDIFDGANWHERETKDMYGIVFTGHPYLQPLLLAEEDADLKPLLKATSAVKPAEKLRWLPPAAPGEAKAKPAPAPATKAAAAAAGAKPAKPAVPVQPGAVAETKDTQE